ncbi:MAG: hypothetical protein QM758_06850 [Armatimonas sp.]
MVEQAGSRQQGKPTKPSWFLLLNTGAVIVPVSWLLAQMQYGQISVYDAIQPRIAWRSPEFKLMAVSILVVIAACVFPCLFPSAPAQELTLPAPE